MDERNAHFVRNDCVIPAPPSASTITIACVGDSITAGGWPQIMQASLNTKYGVGAYNVINFGECGSTMQRHADSPYVQRGSWPKVLATNSSIIVIMLGTNDAKTTADGGPGNWEDDGKTGYDEYLMSYAWMVNQFNNIPSKPDIYVTSEETRLAAPPGAPATSRHLTSAPPLTAANDQRPCPTTRTACTA